MSNYDTLMREARSHAARAYQACTEALFETKFGGRAHAIEYAISAMNEAKAAARKASYASRDEAKAKLAELSAASTQEATGQV